jgi:hypothetical protein
MLIVENDRAPKCLEANQPMSFFEETSVLVWQLFYHCSAAAGRS